MSTALDTNVIISLWATDDALNVQAQAALDGALHRGRLVIAAPVFCELLASPGRTETFLGSFLSESGISVD
jgi:predicted nucleic acid-binding protein